MVIQIFNTFSEIGGWEIKHISRSANEEADSLAKECVSRPTDLLWINDSMIAQGATPASEMIDTV